jgi:hypothetical protein
MSLPSRGSGPVALSLPFSTFWEWLHAHANCILRAGTPDVLLFDHDDFHWHLAAEDESTLLLQVMRAKDIIGEIVIFSNEIAYVQAEPGEADEYIFECVVETDESREVLYQFVMAHGYEASEEPSANRWTH